MRTTVVPAQVTTVEDRIAGRLGVSQLVLLIVPVFMGALLYILLPPFFSYQVYKIVLCLLIAAVCGLLAVRVKGQLLLVWAIALLRYNLRPRYYVASKNSFFAREIPKACGQEPSALVSQRPEPAAQAVLPAADVMCVENLLASPTANVRFRTTKKGELRVQVTEVS